MFKEFSEKVNSRVAELGNRGPLFRVDLSGNTIWDMYLTRYSKEEDPIFRDPDATTHTCNACSSIVRRYGNLVSINPDSGKLESIFSGIEMEGTYGRVAKELDEAIILCKIKDVFMESAAMLPKLNGYKDLGDSTLIGIPKNIKRYTREEAAAFGGGVVKANQTETFYHFHVTIPNTMVISNADTVIAGYRDKKTVFERCMKEIPRDTLTLVRDLINQGSLLDGDAHLFAVEKIIAEKARYDLCKDSETIDNWLWMFTYSLDERVAKFKNTLIGVLCSELAEGMDLNKACLNWNKRVDPANYHKASAPITQRQIKDAQKFVEENGYTPSFNRRFATIDDILVDEIRYMDSGDGSIKSASIFDNVKATAGKKKQDFDKVEEITIEKFLEEVVPNSTGMEIYLDNKHQNNLVTMTKGDDDSRNIFKWDNNYSKTFNGNLAGKSQIKEAVKTAGGAVNGVLRFSIMWASGDGDNSDLDAHAQCADGCDHIFFSDKKGYETGGCLDIDITNPRNQMPQGAVENITYPVLSKLKGRTINFWVNQYSASSSKGFKAELEFDGELHQYEYNKAVRSDVKVATIKIDKQGNATITHHLESSTSSNEVWGIQTKEFHKVNLVCLSPNHWGENNVGNKHYMFMMDKCVPDVSVRSFHNEDLTIDLLKHRKVMEVLGNTTMIEPTEGALSGLGFNSTVRDSVIVKVSGSFNRMLKIKF